MSKSLAGKSAIVTGASRGIGAAIALKLGELGANVAISYSTSEGPANEIVTKLKQLGVNARAYKANATDQPAVAAFINDVASDFGSLDILVNNAAVGETAPITEITDALYDRVFDINVRALFTAVREAVKHMGDGGRIINIGSINGEQAIAPGASLYVASKFAVKGFTQGWARDLASRGITVNVVQPGPIDTDMNPADGEFSEFLTKYVALGRYGKPGEVAAIVAFLASPEASYITGAALNVDGGMMA